MPASSDPTTGLRTPGRRGALVAALGLLAALAGPILSAGPALAAPPAAPGTVKLGNPTPRPALRTFADLRAASRPRELALRAAHAPKRSISPSAPLFGATTTYYALATDDAGGALVRFRTDGKAHVSRRTVLTPSSPDSVVVPSSAHGSTVVAMKAADDGMNVVTIDGSGHLRQLTNDGHSSYGLLTPTHRVLFVTSNDRGESNGLAEIDLAGGSRRSVFRETDPDAVLSLPTLSANGRTVYIVRNVFDRAGQPQSYLLSIDVRTGRASSRPLPGMNYVVSMSASPDGRALGFVGYRAADNAFARWIGFRAEADVIPTVGGSARRVAWVQEPFVVFSRGGSRLVVGDGTRLESVALVGGKHDPMYGTEGLSLPVLAR